MKTFFIILGFIIFVILCKWLERPICDCCGKRIYDKYFTGIGPPANLRVHDKCRDLMYEKMDKDPYYINQSNEYGKMLDRKHEGNPPSKEEWREFWAKHR